MRIEDLKVATLAYEIRDDATDGAIVENFDETEPLTMMMGVGHMMMSFYEGIQGLEAGDSFNFTIAPEKAFGPHKPELVTEVSIDLFMEDGQLRTDLLQLGNLVDIQSNDGMTFKGKVVGIDMAREAVTMDFNTQLAGHTLYVSGKVIGVRDATIEEMDKIVDERLKKGSFRYHGQNCSCKECQDKKYKKLY